MKTYKLISFDLDGTLLNDKMKLSNITVSGLKKLIKSGIICVINSSRNLKSVLDIIKDIKFSYLICLNGSVIYDNINKTAIYKNHIEKNTAENIIKLLVDNNISANIFTENFVYITQFDRGINKKYQLSLNPVILDKTNVKDNILSIELILKNNEIDIYKKFNGVSIHNAGFNFYEITDKSAGKLNALEILLKKIKIKLSDVISIGDSVSDLDLIKKSGLGIAMKNSDNKLLNAADFITETDNNKNGAINCVLKFY